MTEIVRRNDIDMAMLEQVVVSGNLTNLSPAQRLDYYRNVCESVGLNPLTRPFDYITLNSKLTLYAKKDATDQLRKIHGISISKPDMQYIDDVIMVAVTATDRSGRSDADVGVVTVGGLKGEAKANAIMKAITKAKRRVTLSMAGLGWLDETELDTIPTAEPIMVDVSTGEILMTAQNGPQRTQTQQSSNHAAQHRTTPQRPAQPTKTNPVPQDVQFMSNDEEWTDMGREADTNERKDKATSGPFVWPSTEVGLEICAGYRETIADGDVQRMVDYLREKHQSSNGPLSTTNKDGTGAGQYGLLAGKLDYRYSKPAHSAILSAICGRVVNRENPPGWKIKELLDWVSDAETNVTKVGILDQLAEGLKDELMQLEVQ